jgi:Protein of unknown function (DUF1566)
MHISTPNVWKSSFAALITAWAAICCTANAQVSSNIFADGFETLIPKLNDTGLDVCLNNAVSNLTCPTAGFPDQDGDFGRDALARAGLLVKIGAGEAGFDYSKISHDGAVLPAGAMLGTGANDWACTRDNVTGLTWEVKVNNPANLRHMNHVYTWYDTNGGINGGNSGTMGIASICANTLASCNTSAYVAAVNALNLCGASDWRMPSVGELQSIVNFKNAGLAINPNYFPNTSNLGNAIFVWSGDTSAIDVSHAWFIDFGTGAIFLNFAKSNAGGIRLVRGAPP